MVKAELVYLPVDGEAIHLHLCLEVGSTVAEALEASGLFVTNPEAKGLTVGIFSKQVPLERIVKSGDRIEVYRPLTLDPKEKRRQRAKGKARFGAS
ncbi:hypothetical protein BN59_02333 [Legionella massiliensis]|uniref:UPF0125 protein BN59_02333 n=1 Tax=Legionella massiliensis TaxID=1034943 RepID=A0A078KYN5_9GAMM|nr:RnfH family protein [Legionella massiliensis]CDZ78036.1 hypothetical protein BN59_02333 [Legionella massiliensis]CEE13774.1 Persistence and stress-resistance antitoxin PasI [Legionella massiliensis]